MIVAELFAKLGLIPDEKEWKAGHDMVKGLAAAIEGYLSIKAVQGVVQMFKSVANAADDAAKSAMRLGLATETVQEFAHAASMSDLSEGQMEAGFGKLQKGIEKFATKGKGQLADAMKELKIKASEIKNLQIDEVIGKIADKFAEMPDGTHKAGLAMQLFGGAGKSWIPLLNEGAEGIHKLREEAYDLGLVIDEQTAKSFEDFNDTQDRVTKTFQGFKNTLARELLPTISDITTRFLAWIMANREWIVVGIEKAVEFAIKAFDVLGTAVDKVSAVVRSLLNFLDENKSLLVAFATVITARLVPAFTMWAIRSAAAWLATLAPFGPALLLIGLLAVAISAMWKSMGGGEVTMEEAWEAIKMMVDDLVTWFDELPGRIAEGVRNAAQSIVDAFSDAWDSVKKKAADTVDSFFGFFEISNEDIARVNPALAARLRTEEVSDIRAAGGVTQFDAIARVQNARAAFELPRAGGPAANTTTISAGDINVTISGADMSKDELRDVVNTTVRDAQTSALKQAMTNMGGGKR